MYQCLFVTVQNIIIQINRSFTDLAAGFTQQNQLKLGADGNLVTLQLDSELCSPSGGDDLPEDVLGGLNEAVNLFVGSEDEAIVKFIVLIGDGPAHGEECNNGLTDR